VLASLQRVVDRLLARQQRLMQQLDAPAAARTVEEVRSRPSAETLALESEALDGALAHLASGDIAAARALLEPFRHSAALVRTFTTLSGIFSAQGEFEAALDLLERGDALHPSQPKVWRLLAEACAILGRSAEEVHYRRRLAFADPDAPAGALVALVNALHRARLPGAKTLYPEVRLAATKLAAARDADDKTRLRFALAQYAFEGMAGAARQLYASASPPGPDEHDVTAEWTRLTTWCGQEGIDVARLVEEGLPAHRPAMARLSDVHVFAGLQWAPVLDAGKVVLSGFMTRKASLRIEDSNSPLLMNRKVHCELRMPRAPRIVEHPALLIGGSREYYANTIEYFSALAIAEELGAEPSLPLAVNDDLAQFQIQQLELLGYGSRELIRVRANEPALFRQLIVPSRLVRADQWIDPLVPRWYRRKLVDLGSAASAAKRLYLAAPEGTRGRPRDEQALTAMLLGLGFEVVRPEAMNMREQVALFSRASVIAGAALSSMTNIVFAPPGTRVVVFVNKRFASVARAALPFEALARACGHQYKPVACTPSQALSGELLRDAEFDIDLEAARAAVA
jgi:Glycosyltransferase 61/Tetratricopeptide repeat